MLNKFLKDALIQAMLNKLLKDALIQAILNKLLKDALTQAMLNKLQNIKNEMCIFTIMSFTQTMLNFQMSRMLYEFLPAYL